MILTHCYQYDGDLTYDSDDSYIDNDDDDDDGYDENKGDYNARHVLETRFGVRRAKRSERMKVFDWAKRMVPMRCSMKMTWVIW